MRWFDNVVAFLCLVAFFVGAIFIMDAMVNLVAFLICTAWF